MTTEPRYLASLSVPSRVDSIRPAAQFIIQIARLLGVAAAEQSLFEVAIVEALANAFKHGNKQREEMPIVCEIEHDVTHFAVRIFDRGAGFFAPTFPAGEPDPEAVEAIRESGYGVAIIRSVFPIVKPVCRRGRFGVELELPVDAVATQDAAS
jgi:anti-sigma regulatory factor (Ser/Thr protein kinase)